MSINLGAGLISCDLEEMAPAVAASLVDGEFDMRKWGKDGLEQVTPLWLLKYLPNMLACHISIIHDIQGPSNTITCAEAASLLAICEASEVVSRGASDIAIAGGAEGKVNPIVMARQCLLKRATFTNDSPDKACRPFDSKASGSVFGEAAGIVVLENIKNAEDRGAKIYAEIVGRGESNSLCDKYINMEPDGKGIEIAIRKAIEEAAISPEEIDLIIPHGTGIASDDKAEAKAIEAVLGENVNKPIVWPTKSMLSNTAAASGVIDIIAAVYAINEGKIPAARNCDNKADWCRLNISEKEQKRDIKYALCCNYTFGGQVAAVVLKKYDGQV
jgi:3-oxoacyl-[acyl-carrier-protein] synthase II